LGWLRHTETIAAAHRAGAHVAMAVSLAFGGWLVARMIFAAHLGSETMRPERKEN
jgi:hypothetical protein